MTSVTATPSKQDAVHRFKNQVHLLSQTVNGTGREGFDRDFEELEKFDEEMRKDAMRFYSSTLPHNRHKNRYHDIMPNQHTMCMVCGERPESDRYFNGNYVCPPGNFQNYICCQAPLANTCGDFWNVVWYYEVKVVVMLCSEIENGRKKSERYWPNAIGEKIHWDHFDVILKNEETRPQLIVRTLLVTNSLFQEDDAGRSRVVYHYQYTGWPDFGVPESCESILDLMRSVDKVNQAAPGDSKKHPILVHCSAGVGRTGTYVAIHTAIDHFRDGRDFSIFYIVKNLKEQRCGMVQRKEQYKFAFLAALHELERMVSQSYPLQPAKSDNALATSSSVSFGSDTASLSSFSSGALLGAQGSGLNLAMPTVSIPQSPASPTTNPYPLGPHTPLSRVGSSSMHPLSAPVTPANNVTTAAPFTHPGLAQHPGVVGPPGPASPPAVAAPVMPAGGLGPQAGSWQQHPGVAETARAPMSPPMMHHHQQIPHSAPSTPLGGLPPQQQPHPNFDVNGAHDLNQHQLIYRSTGPGLNAQPPGHPPMQQLPPPVPVPTPDMMGANPPQPHMPPPPHMKMQGGPRGYPGPPGPGSVDQGRFYAGQPGRGPPPGQPLARGPPIGKGMPYPQQGGPPFRDSYEHGYPHEHPQHRGHPHQRATSLSPARRPAWSGPDEYTKPYDVPQEYYGAAGPRGARKGPPGSLTSPFGHGPPNPGNPQRMGPGDIERGGPTPAYRRRGSGYNRGVGPGYQ